MPIFQLGEALSFPPAQSATKDGIVAVGGDTSPERLLLAYSQGIFPWPHEGYPLLWFSPDPRFVLKPKDVTLSRSLAKAMKRAPYQIKADTAFAEVIANCSRVPREGQDGTWITDEMRDGYTMLHKMGFAHSIEAWRGDELVGGLYGISLGGMFFGESMFALAEDASKIAFATLIAHLLVWKFDLIDCQSYTAHLARFGAGHIPRKRFLKILEDSLQKPTQKAPWELTLPLARTLELLGVATKSSKH